MEGEIPQRVTPQSLARSRREASLYQRRRAVTACQSCRVRKTKCDNIRPTCGFCARHKSSCVYSDSQNDHSTFDPASLAILDRLDTVVSLLQESSISSPQQAPSQAAASTESNGPAPVEVPPTGSKADGLESDHDACLGTFGFPAVTINCESVLRWPVFHGVVPEGSSPSFALTQQDHQLSDGGVGSSTLGQGIQEEDLTLLSKRYLSYVHAKNPILDVAKFSQYVTEAAENGFRWDGPSCLVLIACALGCIAEPFQPADNDGQPPPQSRAPTQTARQSCLSYYTAARKRLGLIDPSFLKIQCLCLCGALEMYLLKPLRAWHHFNQACVEFQNLFLMRKYEVNLRGVGAEAGSGTEQDSYLQQRLYWSCLKSECEMRLEIPLPASGIHRLSRLGLSNSLPSPPVDMMIPETSLSPGKLLASEDERTWFYYLAEVSSRKIIDNMLFVMSPHGASSWVGNIESLLEHYEDFNVQIQAWSSCIPPQVDWSRDEGRNNELATHMGIRSLACQELLHRPFLYYAVHQPRDDPFMARVMPFAERNLEICVQCLLLNPATHRHHGTWLQTRASATRGLLLLAAARNGVIRLPREWRVAVKRAVDALHYWGSEAGDLKQTAGVFQDLMNTI